jgi:hypothetical protein
MNEYKFKIVSEKYVTDLKHCDEYLSKLSIENWELWIRDGDSKWDFVKRDKIHFAIRIQKKSRTFEVA